MSEPFDDRFAQLEPYDAVLLVSFGGPERPEDVVPFLQNVTRGRNIPVERLEQVGEHYFLFGGRSPINDQCRLLLKALTDECADRGIDLPIYWGNRNWDPYLTETCAEMAAAGHRRVLALTTSAYPSYSSCRQYRENLWDAVADTDLQVDRARNYANHPAFVAASVDATVQALTALGRDDQSVRLVFVTHAIPTAMEASSGPGGAEGEGAEGYVEWHRAVAAAVTSGVADAVGRAYEHDLVYCSRSGPPTQPWTEPDVNDHLRALSADGVDAVVVIPIGFISDHMEVIYDLDTEAAQTAAEVGLQFARAATAGVQPAFVRGLVDLLVERAAAARGEIVEPVVIDSSAPGRYVCPATCCPNLRQPGRPSLCGG